MRVSKRGRSCLGVALVWALAAVQVQGVEEPLSEPMQGEVLQLERRIDGFFGQLTNKGIGPDRAVREIVGNGPLKDRNDEIARLIEQSLTLDQRCGTYTGHERVAARAPSDDLLFLHYLYKGDRFPVVWYFTFYRTALPGSGLKRDWTLIAVRFDTKLEALDR